MRPVLMLAWSFSVVFVPALDAGAAPAEAPSAPRPLGRVRLDLGLSLEPWASMLAGLGGATGLGALGAAGGLVPVLSAAVELRLAGPAWLFVRGSGSYDRSGAGGEQLQSWSARAAAGVRVEPRVLNWLDAGGHVLVEGRLGGATYDRVDQGGAASISAAAGGSLHFRPTPVFGTRLSLDVLRGFYRVEGIPSQAGTLETGGLELTAAPRVELTFTF